MLKDTRLILERLLAAADLTIKSMANSRGIVVICNTILTNVIPLHIQSRSNSFYNNVQVNLFDLNLMWKFVYQHGDRPSINVKQMYGVKLTKGLFLSK